MSAQEPSELIRTLLSTNAMPIDRARAAHRLGEQDTQEALEALLEIAKADPVDELVSRAAGESIARILIRRGEVDQAPLADFNGAAYIGFDETIALNLRDMGGSHCEN